MASLSFPILADLKGKVQNKPALIEWEARRTWSTWHNRPGLRTRVRITTIHRVKHGRCGAHCGDRFFSRSSSSTFKLSTHFSSPSFMLQKSQASGCEPSSQQRNGNGSRCDCAQLMGRLLACRNPGCFGNGSRPFWGLFGAHSNAAISLSLSLSVASN